MLDVSFPAIVTCKPCCMQTGRMAAHLDHMRDHVINGTELAPGNIAVDRWVPLLTPIDPH